MQHPVIRRRSLFFRNPGAGERQRFDVVVSVPRGESAHGDDVDRTAEETVREFSAIFEQLVESGKIPAKRRP